MGAPKNKTYKRSWKNLLLDKSYQLRFTLFMVAFSAILMALLGIWVMKVADQATTVALNHIDAERCPVVPGQEAAASGELDAPGADSAATGDSAPAGEDAPADESPDDTTGEDDEADEESPTADTEPLDDTDDWDSGGDGDAADDAAAEGTAAGDGERPRTVVTIGDIEGDLEPLEAQTEETIAPPPTAAEIAAIQAKRDKCLETQAGLKSDIESRRGLITIVLIAVGLLLVIGLFLYGIKMTHKVAGPLFKVQLYMAKLRDGKYDTVYNLRKGDQLVDFYEHFKSAHAGLRKLQEEDRDRLKEIIEAAEKDNLAEKSPELAASIEELKKLLSEKEESLA